MGNEMHNDYRYIQLSHYVKAIFGVGLESLWEINVQFSETLVTCVFFIEYDNRLFARWRHFTH